MARIGRGRRKIAIARIEKESNRQVTFSKRRFGIFKKASELALLCGVEVCVIIHSPGHKVFSFGYPNVEYVIDKYLNQGHPLFMHHHNINNVQRERISRICFNMKQVEKQATFEKNKKIELKKIRENNRKPQNWWEDPNYDELEGVELDKIKDSLESLLLKATNRIQDLQSRPNIIQDVQQRPPNFYMGSSSNDAANGFGGGNMNSIPGHLDMFRQRGPMNMYGHNYNHQNMNPSNVILPYVANGYGNINTGFLPGYDVFRPPEFEERRPF